MTINYGTGPMVRGSRTAPFMAEIEDINGDGSYTVRRCDIPRRTSRVQAEHVHKVRQYMATPVVGEQFRGSVKSLSVTTKNRIKKTVTAEVSGVQRRNDQRQLKEEIIRREAAVNATWKRIEKKLSRTIQIQKEELGAVEEKHRVEMVRYSCKSSLLSTCSHSLLTHPTLPLCPGADIHHLHISSLVLRAINEEVPLKVVDASSATEALMWQSMVTQHRPRIVGTALTHPTGKRITGWNLN